jgi:GAF domain-containing protein
MAPVEAQFTAEQDRYIELIERAFLAPGIEELVEQVLPDVARLMQALAICIYVQAKGLTASYFHQQGFKSGTAAEIERLCRERFAQISSQTDPQPVTVVPTPSGESADPITLYPLPVEEGTSGIIGLPAQEEAGPISPDLWNRLLRLLAQATSRLAERSKVARQLAHLNTYLAVSSMLAQPLDLHELLDVVLYCAMETVSAEESSVLLLDESKENFFFYHPEGPAKLVLEGKTFPADRGLAGAVLQTLQSEIINDVPNDPRFYGQIDSESGFPTKNMIAIPLTAGAERIGVLEVLNKTGGEDFTEDEHQLLLSIAEEIAFAIRNAMIFEYVVNTYCKQRQGLATCRGCQRPLGSWTPCVKYREADL